MADSVRLQVSEEMLADYKKACVKWDPVLRQLPIRAAQDVLKYFTSVPKLRGKKVFGTVGGNSQYAPFKKDRVSQATTDIEFRVIETHHANVVETFSPVDYIDIPIGYDDPVITDAIKKAGTTLMVLAQLQIARGKHIAQAAMTGQRNANGDTTADVCDGLVTIAQQEITAGKISEAIGNLYKVGSAVTSQNACDVAKEILFALDPLLRRENNFLFCPSDFEDKYNESYLLSHTGIVYNTQYDQPYVEGSKKKLTIVGLPELDGTDMAFVTQPSNLLHGYYNEADLSMLDIMRKDHYTLSSASDVWMGFQFHTIDPRRLMVVDLSANKLNTEEHG